MSLIMPDGSRTINPQMLPGGRGRDYAPPQPAPASPFQGQPDADLLSYLYEELKAKYPGIPDSDLREAAKKLLGELRTKQAEEFHQRFFPERLNQQASQAPQYQPPMPAQPQRGMVAQNEQRPWKYSPGVPGGVEFTDQQNAQDSGNAAILKRVAEEQANFVKTQAQNQANYRKELEASGRWQPGPPGPVTPGQAQSIQPPSQGTPYQPGVAGFPDEDGNQIDDRIVLPPPGTRKNTGKPGNLAPIGPNGERWAF